MEGRKTVLLRLLVLFIVTALPLPAVALDDASKTRTIDVVSHGWHLGLVLPVDRELLEACPPLDEFRGYDAVEIGWGDRGFYLNESVGFGTAIAALGWPTPAVFHVVGMVSDTDVEFPESDILRVEVTEAGYRSLLAELGEEFAAEESIGIGRYGPSLFFEAKGSYYFPKTCNVWTLDRLRTAGIPTRPLLGLRATAALQQLKSHGTTVRWQPKGTKLPFAFAALIGAVWAVRRRRRLHQEPAAKPEKQLRHAWWAIGAWTVALFLATVVSANQEVWAAWVTKGALCGLTATLAACAVIAIDRLRSLARPVKLEESEEDTEEAPPLSRPRRLGPAISAAVAVIAVVVILSPL